MVVFLSDAWIEELNNAASGLRSDPETRVTIEQIVTGPDGHELRWHLALADGQVAVSAGTSDGGSGPRVAFISDYETARAIAAGEVSAQRAFLDGRLRLDGDIDALLRSRPALDALGDLFAAVRAETTGL